MAMRRIYFEGNIVVSDGEIDEADDDVYQLVQDRIGPAGGQVEYIVEVTKA